ncbi:MAG: hypothetical protein IJO33_04785 [Bacilli bacterium]|nr:hypothetical protein [Bacilli bacterium]
MNFFIKDTTDFNYQFIVTKNKKSWESGKSRYIVILMDALCYKNYTVEKIIIDNDKFSIKLNPNPKSFISYDVRDEYINLPFKELIIDDKTKSILERKDIFRVVNGPINNIPIANIKQPTNHHNSLYNIDKNDDYEDEAYFARVLIDTITTTKQGEIAIALNACREAFYDCLHGDENLKKKYFSYICWYNSSQLTQDFDQKTKAAHYLLIAYIFKFYEKYGKANDKTDKLFRIKPEAVIAFINRHKNSNKEELFMAIQNDLENSAPVLNLVKKEDNKETTN